MKLSTLLLLAALFLVSVHCFADTLSTTPLSGSLTPTQLANALLSGASGITINSVSYTGADNASGSFSGGSTTIGIGNGILLTSGDVANVPGPYSPSFPGTNNNLPGSSLLDALLSGASTFDASVLTINFTPTGSQVQFNYVFGSAEYPQFVNSQFNDVFGFFVNGQNCAIVPGTNDFVSINNVNAGKNSSFFVDNSTGTFNTKMGGFTTPLGCIASVNPNVQNTLIIAIADTADHVLDSDVMIAAGTLTTCGGPGEPECGGGPPPPSTVPEPSTLVLLSSGVIGCISRFRRKTRV